MKIEVLNPANGRKVDMYDAMTDDQVRNIIVRAHRTFQDWRNVSFSDRAKLMNAAAGVLRDNQEKYARLMTVEMGKPIKDARSEIEKCAWVCEYYAKHAESFLQDQLRESDATKSYTTYQPLGVVLAVMPWNFPFWQVFRFAAPGLMAGNVGILKHASNVPGCALAIQEVFDRAGFPKHAFTTLLIGSDQVEKVIEHEYVQAATLTGSEKAGSAVAATAGKHIKKTVLELGGSDAYVVLEDADIADAAKTCATSRLINSGQSCIGAKRFIVVKAVYDEFLQHFKRELENAKMGDPMKEDTDIGPQARTDLRDDLHQQVTDSVEKGAVCILGGEIPDREGAYYPATILVNVKKGMPAYEEELFGPVASVIKAEDEDQAILFANDSKFGLGAAVFTQNLERGERIARERLEAGCCFVNAYVKSDPRLPFGGIKTSGYGRELSDLGIREFVNIKTVYVS